MICPPCRAQDHRHCEDTKHKKARYRSCNCQHVVTPVAEPATGPAGE